MKRLLIRFLGLQGKRGKIREQLALRQIATVLGGV
jgi:hypothetical protein